MREENEFMIEFVIEFVDFFLLFLYHCKARLEFVHFFLGQFQPKPSMVPLDKEQQINLIPRKFHFRKQELILMKMNE